MSSEELPIAKDHSELKALIKSHPKPPPTATGGKWEPNILLLDDEQFERLIQDILLAEKKTRGYDKVWLYGQKGDKGRDVVGFYPNGEMDYFQCKKMPSVNAGHLAEEITKILSHSIESEKFLPKKYTLVSAGKITSPALDLLKDRNELASHIEGYCKNNPKNQHALRLNSESKWKELLKRISFDQEQGSSIDKLIDSHREISTRHFKVRIAIDASKLEPLKEEIAKLSELIQSPPSATADDLKWKIQRAAPGTSHSQLEALDKTLEEVASQGAPEDIKQLAENLKLPTPIFFQKPNTSETVARKAVAQELLKKLTQHRQLHIYGLPKAGKSTLVSQVLDLIPAPPIYWWYNFPSHSGTASEKSAFDLLNNLLQFINTHTDCQAVINDLHSRLLAFDLATQKACDLLGTIEHKLTLCFDNGEEAPTNSHLAQTLATISSALSNTHHQAIWISATKSIGFSLHQALSIKAPGFSPEEIIELYKLHKTGVPKLDIKYFQTLRDLVDGHPVVALLLVPELRKLKKAEDFIHLLSKIPKIVSANDLAKTTEEKLYGHWLEGDGEKHLFTRLTALTYSFDEETALAVANVKPAITLPKKVFNKLRSLLLEEERPGIYSVPKFFKDCVQNNLTSNEKNDVMQAAATELLRPRDGVIEAHRSLYAIDYLALSGSHQKAFWWAGILLFKLAESEDRTAVSYAQKHLWYLKHFKTTEPLHANFLLMLSRAEMFTGDHSGAEETLKTFFKALPTLKIEDKQRDVMEVTGYSLSVFYNAKAGNTEETKKALSRILASDFARKEGLINESFIQLSLVLLSSEEKVDPDLLAQTAKGAYEQNGGRLPDNLIEIFITVYDKYVRECDPNSDDDKRRISTTLDKQIEGFQKAGQIEITQIIGLSKCLLEFEFLGERDTALAQIKDKIASLDWKKSPQIKFLAMVLHADLLYIANHPESLDAYKDLQRASFPSGINRFYLGHISMRTGLLLSKEKTDMKDASKYFLQAFNILRHQEPYVLGLQCLGEYTYACWMQGDKEKTFRALSILIKQLWIHRGGEFDYILLLACNFTTWLDYTIHNRPLPKYLNPETKTEILEPQIGRYLNLNFSAEIVRPSPIIGVYLLGGLLRKVGKDSMIPSLMSRFDSMPAGDQPTKTPDEKMLRFGIALGTFTLLQAHAHLGDSEAVIKRFPKLLTDHHSLPDRSLSTEKAFFNLVAIPLLNTKRDSPEEILKFINELKKVIEKSSSTIKKWWDHVLTLNECNVHLYQKNDWRENLRIVDSTIEQAETDNIFDAEMIGRFMRAFTHARYFPRLEEILQYHLITLKRTCEIGSDDDKKHFGNRFIHYWRNPGWTRISAMEIAALSSITKKLSTAKNPEELSEENFKVAGMALLGALGLLFDSRWEEIRKELS